MKDVLLTLIVIMLVLQILDFVIFFIQWTSLAKKGVDINRWYDIMKEGKIPELISVKVTTKLEEGVITNRWHGKGEYGVVVDVGNGKEKLATTSESQWNNYKTGDTVLIRNEIVYNKQTDEMLEDACRCYIIGHRMEDTVVSLSESSQERTIIQVREENDVAKMNNLL